MTDFQTSTIGLYAIKDVNIGMYLPPFLCLSDDEAKRMVSDAIEPGSVLGRYPADFHLVRVGKFNSKSGISHYPADELPEVICSVTDIVRESVLQVSIDLDAPKEVLENE